MAVYFSPTNIPEYWVDDDGDPAANYTLHAFDSGASTTPRTIFQDNAGTSAGTSVTLDALGYVSTSGTRHPIWLDESINHRLELRDDSSTVIWQADNVKAFHGITINSVDRTSIKTYLENREVADYAAFRALTSAQFADGDKVTITNSGIFGDFFIRTGTVTDDAMTLLVFTDDSNRYGERIVENGECNILWSGFSTSETGANNKTHFETAVSAANSKTLVIPGGTTAYPIIGLPTITNAVTIKAHGATLEWTSNTTDQGLKITSSNVHIEGGTWKGPQFASFSATQIGIWFEGTNPSTYLNDVSVCHAKVHNWGGENIRFRMCQNFWAHRNRVYDGRLAGINCLSVLDGHVFKNHISNLDGDATPEGYGIQCTKNNGASSVWPLPERVTIEGNTVKDIVDWEGVDTHGGIDIHFINNIIHDCKLGIVVTRFNDGSNTYAPKRCIVIGNTIVNNTIAKTNVSSSVANGIQIVGVSSSVTADECKVIGNTIENYGREAGALGTLNFSAGLYGLYYENLTVSDNTIKDSGTHGMLFEQMGKNLKGNNNNIEGLTDSTTGSAIYFDGDGLTASGELSNTTIDVTGYIGVYCQADTAMDMLNTKFVAATTNWSQNGGTFACEFLNIVDPVHVGVDTDWNPNSIANNARESYAINSIPGCSAKCSVADIGFNRDLQGMSFSTLTADTNTTTGTVTIYMNNNSGGAINLDALTIPYRVVKLQS